MVLNDYKSLYGLAAKCISIANALAHVAQGSQTEVSEALKVVFVQRDKMSAKAEATELVRALQIRFSKAMEIFEAGIDDVLNYLSYPQSHRVRISFTIRWRN